MFFSELQQSLEWRHLWLYVVITACMVIFMGCFIRPTKASKKSWTDPKPGTHKPRKMIIFGTLLAVSFPCWVISGLHVAGLV